MKFIINNRLVLAAIMLCSIILAGCQDGDGDADYGFAFIYMPQATVSGGLNNHYAVPDGGGVSTYNFKEENGKVHIYLGVLRSGHISGAAGFTVDVAVSSTLTDEAITSGEISNAMALPSNLYTIPNKATVEKGESSTSFFLTVDSKLFTDDTYTGKNMLLAVEIANPTQYELSEQNTSVLVVIDVEEMKEHLLPEEQQD